MIFSTPRPQDGKLDFGLAPALPAVMPTRAVSAENSSTAASGDAAVRGSDKAACGYFPTPRPQDGTRDFGVAPALPAAVPTRAEFDEKSSTAGSFDAAVGERKRNGRS